MVNVNFDDALFSREQKLGIGVVIRDAQGAVLASLSKILCHIHSPFEVEGLAAASALQLASDLGFQEVILDGDCQVLVLALKHDSDFLSAYGIILDVVRLKARCFNKLHYFHVNREGNMVAHGLARFVLNVLYCNVWMKDVPPQFHSLVLADSDGIH